MDDQRVIHRTTLRLKNAAYRLSVEGIRRQTVDRFGRYGDQTAVTQDGGCLFDIRLCVG